MNAQETMEDFAQAQIEALRRELEKTQEKLKATETKLNKVIDMVLELVEELNTKEK